MIKLKQTAPDGSFKIGFLVEAQGRFVSVSELCGNIAKMDEAKSSDRSLTETEAKSALELYRGPDDPRLPEDIKKMPVGKREDFVDTFNSNFWWYSKDEDKEYDENERRDVNIVRYCNRMAYDKVAGKKSGNSNESKNKEEKPNTEKNQEYLVRENGQKAVRISEKFVGVILPKKTTKESAAGGSDSEDYPVVIIEKGWSLNRRYYTERALRDIAEQINKDKPGFMNHGQTFGRDPRDWAIMVHSASVEPSRVEARMHVFNEPDGPFLKERIEKASHLFGGSIDAFVIMEDGEIDGDEGPIVQEVVELNCWDIVMFPGAGGAMIPSKESAPGPSQSTPEGRETMDLATLKKDHPALYQLILSECTAAVKAELEPKIAEAKAEAAKASEAADKASKENTELRAKIDVYETAQRKAAYEAEVDKMIEAELSKEQRSDAFRGILVDLGPDGTEMAKKLIGERKAALGEMGTPRAIGNKASESRSQKKENEKTDDQELEGWGSSVGREKAA